MEQRAVPSQKKKPDEVYLKNTLNISELEKQVGPLEKAQDKRFIYNDISRFRESLEKTLTANIPAKELVTIMVKTALETEFGKTFTLMRGFDKMLLKISDSIMTDPALRRQALSVVSLIIDKRPEQGKKKN